MKDLIIRIAVILIFAVLVVLAFTMIPKVFTKTNYKYLTYEETWGNSNKCYNDKGDLSCETDKGIIRVVQYYEEDQ